MKKYSCHDLLNMTMTGEEQFCLASEVDAVNNENERLRKALATVPVMAGLIHKLWDSDQDAKVGKWLIALAGGLPGYTALTDELHAAIATAPQYEQPRSATGER